MSKEFIIRGMTEDEVVNVAVEWAAAEGWNPGLSDGHCFYSTDKNGFFIGILDGEPIACISAVAYDSDFGFLGFYIVKPEYRGKGYGLQIWNAATDYLKEHNTALDGVVEQQHNYKKSGFRLAYNNIRYAGKSAKSNETFGNIIPLNDVSFEEILHYDLKLFPASRPAFLKCWAQIPGSVSLASVGNNSITGYCVLRECRNGYKFGPLFADDADISNKLFLSACNLLDKDTAVYLDTPEVNPEAVSLAESYGMTKVFQTARMYTKSQPEININKIFGLTTFELG